MALEYPQILPGVFAAGAVNHENIPDTDADAGRMAWDVGFPSETSQPIAAGGVPPRRLDMNGLGNRLSQHIMWQQSGGLYTWDAGLDYPEGAHILGSNGTEYIAVADSGPSQVIGAVDPTTDVNFTAWKSFQRSLVDIVYPVGSIYMSVNSVSPATLFGGTWQAISGRFLLAAGGNYSLGSTGGAATKTLTVENMPSHTHTGSANNYTHTHNVTTTAKSISVTTGSAGSHTHGVTFPQTTVVSTSAGSHTHTRGTMEITGRIAAAGLFDADTGQYEASGALSKYTTSQNKGDADKTGSNTWGLALKASDGWTGATASNGAHTHNVTIAKTDMATGSAGAHTHSVTVNVPAQTNTSTSNTHNHTVTVESTGGGAAFNVMPPYLAVNIWKRTA